MTTQAGRDSDPGDPNAAATPVGRDAVAAAVLSAAADLYAERGPAATSIRDVAERAGVNHGLVFRHFGAKDALVAAVLNHLAAESESAIGDAGAGAGGADPRLRRHWIVLARCLLDGYPVGAMQDRFPVVSRLIEQTPRAGRADGALALDVAHAVAFRLGWELFAPFLRAAAGLDALSEDELDAAVDERVRRLLLAGGD
ncbi:helix-turn-helix domain-containing protein [Nocardia thailandica]|uniref:TetR/AcrR family transcriptional regulator n=1 Tax=Nocardia thailandica TaxID=257275 RepID=UPI0009FE4145|nr:TetR/AcrR family transcriptional regulator [Nocardia thailandica]